MTSQTGRQQQFLDIVSRDEATRRFRSALSLEPLGSERLALSCAAGRVLSENIISGVDVPGFDRSNVDGYAVRSSDLRGADEESRSTLRINAESLSPGRVPTCEVTPRTATLIATGGMIPRGADAVVMVEYTDVIDSPLGPELIVSRMIAPGGNISSAGSDISCGETVLWSGQLLTARELGVLAAVGLDHVAVYRRPRVAILSTGDEIVPPGQPLPVGMVYDSNAAILAATVRELGCEAVELGCVRDDLELLRERMQAALKHDAVVLSGGTSKGEGDLSYQIVRDLGPPGIVAHGVALKPGKPICLAVHEGKPVVVLPGFPTSAIFTFHEFLAPVLRLMAGHRESHRAVVRATVPQRINSERGRTEYLLVGLVRAIDGGWSAYPMGKGSGSVTTFSGADGFITIPQQTECLDAGMEVEVTLLDEAITPADLVIIGSHCVGLDLLLGEMRRQGFTTRSLTVGSQGGLSAAQRGECDLAGVHLYDPQTGTYNEPFLTPGLAIIPGYTRQQCLVFRRGDPRFEGRDLATALQAVGADLDCRMMNRNPGSGTRILIDEVLRTHLPSHNEGIESLPGYRTQTKSHNAVAAAVAQGRADWGMAIETVVRDYGLGMIPVREERYDFLVPLAKRESPTILALERVLADPAIHQRLAAWGLMVTQPPAPLAR